ncbi:MAG: epoxyqueuosine reductase QueH [Fretibacterium sp.]|nr:epoxyqueuosine reductase QueH [Fretibacterium sp.]
MVQKSALMLHICCAPDATVPVEDLTAEGWQVAGFFYGSNIQPVEEYRLRLGALHKLMDYHNGLPVEEAPYAPDVWLSHMLRLGLMEEPEGGARCTACFELQLEAAARAAIRLGCSHLCTSLTISPHKDAARITSIGERIAEENSLTWEPRIWRKKNGFLRSIRASKELGLYRQNYCGCMPSLLGRESPAARQGRL